MANFVSKPYFSISSGRPSLPRNPSIRSRWARETIRSAFSFSSSITTISDSGTNNGSRTVGFGVEHETHPFAQRVDGQIEVTGTRPDAFGLRAEDVLLEPLEADHVVRRLDADAGLVPVVLAGHPVFRPLRVGFQGRTGAVPRCAGGRSRANIEP